MNRRVLAGLILAMALPALDLMALGAAAPAVADDLGRLDQVAWLFVGYQLALVVSVPLYGKLGDLRGRRVVFLSSVTVFTLSSLLAGVAWSFPVLVAARVAQGLGGGGIISQTHAVIADLVPPRERGNYSWVTPTVWTIAAFMGPVFGGALAEHADWRWIFLLNLPFGLLAIVFVRDAFPDQPTTESRSFDAAGAVMLVVSYGALVFAVSVGGDLFEWSHPAVVASFLVGGIVLLGFLAQELRSADPVMPLRMLRVPVVRSSAATTFFIGSVNFFAVAFLPLMLQLVTGVGATQAGLAILPTTACIALASTITGRVVVRTGHYRTWPIIGSALFVAGYWVLSSLDNAPATWVVWSGTGLLGLGMGMGSPVFMVAMQNAVPHRDVGVVSAMAMFARNTGQVFGVAIAGALFVARLGHHLDRLVPSERLGGLDVDDLRGDVDLIRSLDPAVEALVVEAYRSAVTDVFTIAIWGGVLSLIAAATIPQIPLRDAIDN
ncbi:MAG: MFS transporter [Acidimicrobiales bacterium]|nr:MFS transporter [Acidimicrobiales bacterium]